MESCCRGCSKSPAGGGWVDCAGSGTSGDFTELIDLHRAGEPKCAASLSADDQPRRPPPVASSTASRSHPRAATCSSSHAAAPNSAWPCAAQATRTRATGLLREGLDLGHRCGARPLAEQARRELLAAGARPRRPRTSGIEALTPSELRVAQLARDGLTNRQIAQSLFVTLRTVRVHLTATYRKLGINSREALSAALPSSTVTSARVERAAHPPPPERQHQRSPRRHRRRRSPHSAQPWCLRPDLGSRPS